MSRYIDADEALRMIRNSKQDCPLKDDKKSIWGVAHNCCISCVEAAPTADVVEVRYACWETVTELKNFTACCNEVKIQYKICSNCKYPMGITDNVYCGHCGAKMDGERREEKDEHK